MCRSYSLAPKPGSQGKSPDTHERQKGERVDEVACNSGLNERQSYWSREWNLITIRAYRIDIKEQAKPHGQPYARDEQDHSIGWPWQSADDNHFHPARCCRV